MPCLPERLSRLLEGETRVRYSEDGERYLGNVEITGTWRAPCLSPEGRAAIEALLPAMEAAIQPAPWEETVKLLTRLRMHRPMQTKDEVGISVVLEDTADDLARYCLTAIAKGIAKLRRSEPEPWFPTARTLIGYIHPLHWRYETQCRRLRETLELAGGEARP